MIEDSIIRQVRAAREEYASSHGFDVRKIVADLQELDRAGDWIVTRLAPRRPRNLGVVSIAPMRELSAGESESATSSK